jgi:uncharacterized protein YaaW (UPF0174 family)
VNYLLSYYDRVEPHAISVQAAVLEEVTYARVMATGAKQTYAKAKGAAKWIIDKVGVRNSIDATAAKSTAELVMDRAAYWSCQANGAARRCVFNLLGEHLQVPPTDLALMSTRLIEEAAAGYGISEDLLLSQQAEAVANKYLEDCIEGLREQLKKQGKDAIKATEQVMSQQIASMSPAERLEIQRALNLETLSASSLRDTFLKSGLPIAGIAALQAGGFGTYLALTTIMHAVFTSMLGITLPFAAYTTASSALSLLTGPVGIMLSLSIGFLGFFWGQRKIERSQYAMVVWTCVMHAQEPLVPATSSLPSAQLHRLLMSDSGPSANAPATERQDFEALEQERAQKALASHTLETTQKSANDAERRMRLVEDRLRRAKASLASSSSRQNAESQLNSSLEFLISTQQQSIIELRENLVRATKATEDFKVQLARERQNAADSDARFVNRLERRAKQLRALWTVHYPNIDFNQQPLRWAAEQDFAGWLEIERALKELADAPDPVKLSRSRIHATHEHHSKFTIPNGVQCRMFYAVKNGRIDLRRMCKKKDC